MRLGEQRVGSPLANASSVPRIEPRRPRIPRRSARARCRPCSRRRRRCEGRHRRRGWPRLPRAPSPPPPASRPCIAAACTSSRAASTSVAASASAQCGGVGRIAGRMVPTAASHVHRFGQRRAANDPGTPPPSPDARCSGAAANRAPAQAGEPGRRAVEHQAPRPPQPRATGRGQFLDRQDRVDASRCGIPQADRADGARTSSGIAAGRRRFARPPPPTSVAASAHAPASAAPPVRGVRSKVMSADKEVQRDRDKG